MLGLLWRGLLLVLTSWPLVHGQGFEDNTTLWVDGSPVVHLFTGTMGWLVNQHEPNYSNINFIDARRSGESISAHYLWQELVISERGTKTIAVYQRTTGRAVFAHIGTTPLVGHVVVDWLSNNVYWTDPGFGWIGLQALKEDLTTFATNSRLRVIVSTSLDSPYGITILPHSKALFWSDHGNPPKLETSDLLGRDRRVLVWQGLFRPTALSADLTTGRLYWLDQAKGTVETCDQQGEGRRIIVSSDQGTLAGLQVFEDFLIVTDSSEETINGFRKDTGNAATLQLRNVGNAGDIIVFSSALQPRDNATCDNVTCDHICIHGESCVCASGYTLSADGANCTESATSLWKSFLVSTRTKICALPINLLFSHIYLPKSGYPIQCFVSDTDIRHLAVDPRNATLYYVTGRVIRRYVTQSGTDESVYTTSGDVTGLALDWVRGTLLWVQDSRLYSLAPGAAQPSAIYTGLSDAAHLTVDSQRGDVFWVERPAGTGVPSPQIWSGSVNGSLAKAAVLTSDLTTPGHLTYDYKTNRLYWLDGDYVGSVERDGQNKHISSLSSLNQYVGLAVFRGYMVWSASAGSSPAANLSFRGVDLTENEDFVTFELPDEVRDVTDLVIYDSISNQDTGVVSCEIDNGGCSQLCLVEGSSYTCRCHYGFQLHQDGVTCVTDYTTSDFFLVTDSEADQLYQVRAATQQVSAAQLSPGSRPQLAVHNPLTNEIVWWDAQAAAIKTSRLDGTAVRVVRSLRDPQGGAPNTVGALRIDLSTSNLFFTEIKANNSQGWIRVISLTMGVMRTLYQSPNTPRYLDIAPTRGLLVFGTDTGTILKCDMDMTPPFTQLRTGITALSGLVFSQNGAVVEWSDRDDDGIWQMSLSTLTATQRLQSSGSHPHDLQSWGSDLYYLTSSGRTIKSLSSSNIETTVVEQAEFGLLSSLIYVGQNTAEVRTSCSDRNGRCSTLCLPKAADRQCQCGDGVSLLEDMRTCGDVEQCGDNVQNGQLSTTCDRYPDETCTYTCRDGYTSNPDTPSIVCGTSGQWKVSTDGLCLVTCPKVLANGRFPEDCSGVAGRECSVTCNSGYSMNDQAAGGLRCGQDGQWGISLETVCQAKEEEALPVYAIAIISAGAVALIAVALGCFLYRRNKKYGRRDSHRERPRPEPSVIFTRHMDDALEARGATGGVPAKHVEEEVYDELENVDESVRYHSFDRISPMPDRKRRSEMPGGHVNPGLTLSEDDRADGDYFTPLPDYFEVQGQPADSKNPYATSITKDTSTLPPPPYHGPSATSPTYLSPTAGATASPLHHHFAPSYGDYLTPHLPPHRGGVSAQQSASPPAPGRPGPPTTQVPLPDYLAPPPPASAGAVSSSPGGLPQGSDPRTDWTA